MTNYNPQDDQQWWTQQWLELINSYRFKKRLERGWKYAREGNVLSIDFQDQKAIARVQGTETEPYEVSLWLETFSDEDWEYVIKNLAGRAIFSAKLLAGEMPANIEEVFAAAGLRLFPFRLDEVKSLCSCPDKANPCKHISAVYYLLGDRFSEDPFVLFQLRGRTKQQIITALRQLRGNGSEDSGRGVSPESAPDASLQPTLKIEQFWQYNQQLEYGLVAIVPPPSSETVLDVLGPISIESAATGQAVKKYLDEVYKNVSQQAVLTALNRGE